MTSGIFINIFHNFQNKQNEIYLFACYLFLAWLSCETGKDLQVFFTILYLVSQFSPLSKMFAVCIVDKYYHVKGAEPVILATMISFPLLSNNDSIFPVQFVS